MFWTDARADAIFVSPSSFLIGNVRLFKMSTILKQVLNLDRQQASKATRILLGFRADRLVSTFSYESLEAFAAYLLSIMRRSYALLLSSLAAKSKGDRIALHSCGLRHGLSSTRTLNGAERPGEVIPDLLPPSGPSGVIDVSSYPDHKRPRSSGLL